MSSIVNADAEMSTIAEKIDQAPDGYRRVCDTDVMASRYPYERLRQRSSSPGADHTVFRYRATSTWSISRRMEVSRPKKLTTTQTWRKNSSTSTTVPSNPSNGPVSTRTCCPFCGDDGGSRCSFMVSPFQSSPTCSTTPRFTPAAVTVQHPAARRRHSLERLSLCLSTALACTAFGILCGLVPDVNECLLPEPASAAAPLVEHVRPRLRHCPQACGLSSGNWVH
jgi:hypothetical protein